MPNLANEEIRVMQNTVAHLNMAIPLETNQAKKLRMKETVKELESLIRQRLDECGEFHDIRVEEDIY